MFEGIIIEESLEDKAVLGRVEVLSTRVEPVTEGHQTPWLSRWTLHTVRIGDEDAEEVARLVSGSIDTDHATSWYADFKDETQHYVVFRDRVFRIDRRSAAQYEEARDYGISRGLPPWQADFSAPLEE